MTWRHCGLAGYDAPQAAKEPRESRVAPTVADKIETTLENYVSQDADEMCRHASKGKRSRVRGLHIAAPAVVGEVAQGEQTHEAEQRPAERAHAAERVRFEALQ